MDWRKLKIVLKLSKSRHAGAIAPDSISSGAFYFPAPRDKGRKQNMYTWEELLNIIQKEGKENILDERIYNKQCQLKKDLTEREEYEIAIKVIGIKY